MEILLVKFEGAMVNGQGAWLGTVEEWGGKVIFVVVYLVHVFFWRTIFCLSENMKECCLNGQMWFADGKIDGSSWTLFTAPWNIIW